MLKRSRSRDVDLILVCLGLQDRDVKLVGHPGLRISSRLDADVATRIAGDVDLSSHLRFDRWLGSDENRGLSADKVMLSGLLHPLLADYDLRPFFHRFLSVSALQHLLRILSDELWSDSATDVPEVLSVAVLASVHLLRGQVLYDLSILFDVRIGIPDSELIPKLLDVGVRDAIGGERHLLLRDDLLKETELTVLVFREVKFEWKEHKQWIYDEVHACWFWWFFTSKIVGVPHGVIY